MERNNIKRHIKNYQLEVAKAIYDPIIEKDVGSVKIDETKAFFLLLPKLNEERWTHEMNVSAIAVGAVHAALDAHDSINKFDATSRRQQLTVLSGDHFSGVHYRLLASLPNFDFIRVLSKTIGQINELKTIYYRNTPSEQSELIQTICTIDAGCISDFLHTFGFSKYADLANVALTLHSLKNNIALKNMLGYEDVADEEVEEAIRLLQVQLEKMVDDAHFLTPYLQKEIRSIATSLQGKAI